MSGSVNSIRQLCERRDEWLSMECSVPNAVRLPPTDAWDIWHEIRPHLHPEVREACERKEGHPLDGGQIYGLRITVAEGVFMLSRREVPCESR